MTSFQTILNAALTLSPEERELLTAKLSDSLRGEDREQDLELLAEAHRRFAEYESGVVQGIPWEIVRRSLLSQ